MEELSDLKRRLEEERPAEWDRFPDLGLYMDQVVSYLSRQLIRFEEGDTLTPAMINNYIKFGLLPRADGKKYSRAHLAYLTAICVLKQVLSVKEIDVLLEQESKGAEPQVFYEKFISALDEELKAAALDVEADWGLEELSRAAVRLAISSYAQKLACQRMIAIIEEKSGDSSRKRAREKEEKKAKEKAEKIEKIDEENT